MHATKTYRRAKIQFRPFLTTAHDGGWSAPRYDRFIHRARAPGTRLTGEGLSPTAGLAAFEQIKVHWPCRE